jgi:UrcA family protein
MFRPIFCSLGLCAAILSATSASAQDSLSVHVSYADLNLNSPAGAAVFQRRVRSAVEQICYSDDRTLSGRFEVDHCKAAIQTQAQQKVAAVMSAARATQFAARSPDRNITLAAH